MTTTLTPTTIGDQVVAILPDLADSIAQARSRFDASKKAEEDDKDDDEDDTSASSDAKDDDSKMSFADKMKAAKASKAAKKDSDDVEAIFARIDALEAENAVLASLVKQEEPHEDAPGDMEDDGEDEGDDEDMTPQQIALQMIDEFTEAKPFLPPDADITKYQDIYDIYQDAIAHCYPDALVKPDLAQEDDDDRINPMDADELRGAFLMMVIASHGMKMAPGVRMSPGMSMDSAESDRSFATALGLRTDGCDDSTMPKEPKRTEYY